MRMWWLLLLYLVGNLFQVGKTQVTSTGCGTTKGCYRDPATCTDGSNCNFFATWNTKQDGSNIFTITGSGASSYIAIGFSTSSSMAGTDVYACTSNNAVVRSRNTNGRNNDASQPLKGVSDESISFMNGRIECTFTRQASLSDGDSTYYDLNGSNTYYVLMAKSNTGDLQADGNIDRHDERIAGSSLTSFTGYPVMQAPTDPPSGIPATNPPASTLITSGGCGTTKGCFRSPDTCTDGTNCDFFVSWVADQSGNVMFEMTGTSTSTYIALGFSKSGGMSDSDVYACTSNNEMVRARNTNGRNNDASPLLKGVSDIAISIINGRIECTFTRQASLNDGDSTYYDLSGSNTYYVIMAKSDTGALQDDGNIAYHDNKIADTALTSFQDIVQMPPPPPMTTPPPMPMTAPPGYTPISSEGCGTTKGCFRSPNTCTDGTNCDFFVSWVADQSGIIMFEMTGTSSGTYIALGFSTSSSMADSDVYACTSNNEMVRSRNTNGRVNDASPQLKGVSDAAITTIDGRIECTFTRQASLNDGDSTYYDLSGSNTYYVIMAKSDTGDLQADGNIDYHDNKIADTALTSFQNIVQMTPPPAMPTPPPMPMTAPPGYTPISSEGCGTTKGCFRSPDTCTDGTNCDFFVSWVADQSGNIMFEMTGSSSGTYIALGFSTSSSMANTDVYACTSNNEVVRSMNAVYGYTNHVSTLKGVSGTTITKLDGRIECTFTRQASLNDGDSTYYDLSGSNTYYVIMAKSNTAGGLLNDGSGNIDYHDARIADIALTSFQDVVQMPPEVPPTTAATTLAPGQTQPSAPATKISIDGCGSIKGCFRRPADCTGLSDCEFFVSWTSDEAAGNNVFTMTGKDAGSYIGLGFSKTGAMADSDVYACTINNEVVRSRNTNANINDPSLPLVGVTDVSVSVINGQIECEFTRQASMNVRRRRRQAPDFYDLSAGNMYYVIMAKSSDPLQADGNIGYHTGGRDFASATSSFIVDATATQGPPMTTKPVTNPTSRNKITSEGCGVTKGCFRTPSSCTGPSDCDYFASWTADKLGNNVFSLTGAGTGSYIAIGFSKSGQMRDSDVYACTSKREVVRSRNTVGNSNDPTPPLKGVSDVTVAIVDGQIECEFTRQASLDDNETPDETYYDLSGNNTYYIIMAKSSSNGLRPDGNILQHTDRQTGSQQAFSEFNEATGVADKNLPLKKAHGCLMVVAWLVLASIGITMARYYKPMAPGKKYCKKPVWFAVHRFVMVSAFLLTVAAFIIIFISVGGFIERQQDSESGPDTRFLHALLGTLVTFLAITNPIMAMFRCHPGTPKRPIFDRAHWAVGTSAHILGIITICLAVTGVGSTTPILIGLPPYLFWVMVVFIIAHITLWIFLECKTKCMKSSNSAPDIPMATPNSHDNDGPAKIYPNLDTNMDPNSDPNHQSQQQLTPPPEKKSTEGIMNYALNLYLLIILVVAAIMIITIAIT
ncbi:uncharacterized protein [Amphiura filiformis]|uniref:uncharacterized protein isoform X3 n=1 Tax=Amphiura filiformis TaxID=82378 RepID=UPI003B222986